MEDNYVQYILVKYEIYVGPCRQCIGTLGNEIKKII